MQEINEIKSFIVSMLHVKTWTDVVINVMISMVTFFVTYACKFIQINEEIFIMITVVVLGDFFFGVMANLKNFQTKKALKVIWYFVAYNLLAYIVLIIEKAHPSAFWLSETVIMPIMVFQMISILKNMRKAGVLPSSILDQILDKIDSHKTGGRQE